MQVFFTEGGKLVVEVVMVRDMCRDDDTTSVGSHGILSRGPEPISSYVKVMYTFICLYICRCIYIYAYIDKVMILPYLLIR